MDGDILTYRIGWSAEALSEEYMMKGRMEQALVSILMDSGATKGEGFLTLDSASNFRHQIAKTAPYKGQRPNRKPKWYDWIRIHLVEEWGFEAVTGIEADDAIATRATELGDDSIICSIDKDFDQVPGWHYNFVKREKYYVSEEEGLRNFYRQILTGDRIDNIIGIKGVGPVKADRILDEKSSARQMFDACVLAFEGDRERVIENARLLYLRRREGDVWEPPQTA